MHRNIFRKGGCMLNWFFGRSSMVKGQKLLRYISPHGLFGDHRGCGASLPRHIFAKLETILEDDRSRHDAHQAVGSGRKRQHDSEEQAIEEMKPRKRERKDAAPNTTATLLASILSSRPTDVCEEVKSQTEDKVGDEEEASTEIKAEWEASETRLRARGAIWEEQWSKIEAFGQRQRLLTAVGTYALSCPLIEDRYTGLEGLLRLSVEFIPGTDDTRVLHGQLDLSLFTGAVAFAVSDAALHVWCYDKTRRPTHPNGEMDRLRAWGRDARTTLGLQRKSDSSCAIPRADFDLSAELRLCGEFMCNDDRKLFLRPGLILANDFDIDFTDLSGLSFTGRIKLPMLSDEPAVLEGFTFEETATKTGRSWSEYDTASIRYGSVWNEP
ncbi:hypothetical protein FB567DRAFT_117184 [Paraphoma chrysanthemicola]|uniref:Uncharacterized protein n=1 Tax=Paraphoma chrysanthemicola TaxID=798071 RepID=A0A8K0R0M0_9PLEO|nr:hypothetical protein FB567DRAFT_117184 [Paraphoma chrysanthemicola]